MGFYWVDVKILRCQFFPSLSIQVAVIIVNLMTCSSQSLTLPSIIVKPYAKGVYFQRTSLVYSIYCLLFLIQLKPWLYDWTCGKLDTDVTECMNFQSWKLAGSLVVTYCLVVRLRKASNRKQGRFVCLGMDSIRVHLSNDHCYCYNNLCVCV